MRNNLIHFSSYFLIFLCYFWQLPKNNSVPGNCDTFFAIAYSNSYLNHLKGLFFNELIGSSMFPISQYYGFGETSFGCSILFIFFKLLFKNDLYSYYLFCVSIFTLTSFFFAKFCSTYIKGNSLVFFTGLIFSFSNFTIGNIDSIHTVFFGILFASLYLYRIYEQKKEIKNLYSSFFLSGVGAYFSVYVFFFNIIFLGIFSLKGFTKNHFIGIVLVIFLVFPHFLFYFQNINKQNFVNPWNPHYISELHSLDFSDFLRKIPGNIYNKKGTLAKILEVTEKFDNLKDQGYLKYYTPINPKINLHFNKKNQLKLREYRTFADSIVNYPFVRRSAFTGFLLFFLSCWGFKITDTKNKWQLSSIFFIGFFLSMGPLNSINNFILPTPMYPFFDHFYFVNFLRVPSRAFFLSLISMIILASICIEYNFKKNPLWFSPLLLILLENIPFSLKKYKSFISPPQEIAETFKGEKKLNTILDLPSDLGIQFRNDYKNFFSYSREILYMNYQTYHHQNILNGVNGYIPKSRLEAQNEIDDFLASGSIGRLFKKIKPDYIVFHKNLVLTLEEGNILSVLKKNPSLKKIKETEETVIFKFLIPN